MCVCTIDAMDRGDIGRVHFPLIDQVERVCGCFARIGPTKNNKQTHTEEAFEKRATCIETDAHARKHARASWATTYLKYIYYRRCRNARAHHRRTHTHTLAHAHSMAHKRLTNNVLRLTPPGLCNFRRRCEGKIKTNLHRGITL